MPESIFEEFNAMKQISVNNCDYTFVHLYSFSLYRFAGN